MKKVLIFGVSGFAGRYLALEFQNHGYKVLGSDRVYSDALPPDIDFMEADLMDPAAVAELVQKTGTDMVINLAAVSSVGASWEIPQATMSVNVIGALNIMEAARGCRKPPKVMFIGSSEEYRESGTPISEKSEISANSPYGISKMAQGNFAGLYRNRYGLQIYYVRPFNHTGIGQKETFVLPGFCRQVAEIEKSGRPGKLLAGNLDIVRDFSDVRDIVRAYRMVIEGNDCTKVFNVGSGKAYTLRELLRYIISLSSQNIEVTVDRGRFRPVDNPVICCDYGYIKSELGWEPEFSIFDTLKEMYCFYLQDRAHGGG